MPRVLVMFMDYTGLPRAWAAGPNRDQAEAEARRQLQAYCARKAETGDVDLSNPNRFSLHVELLP